jgi:hypothetical protein
MSQHSEKITIVITYDEMPLSKLASQTCRRKIEVYGADNSVEELLFSETESVNRGMMKTRSGVAGAVNLLYGLLFDLPNTYYINDDHKCDGEFKQKLTDALKRVVSESLQ